METRGRGIGRAWSFLLPRGAGRSGLREELPRGRGIGHAVGAHVSLRIAARDRVDLELTVQVNELASARKPFDLQRSRRREERVALGLSRERALLSLGGRGREVRDW